MTSIEDKYILKRILSDASEDPQELDAEELTLLINIAKRLMEDKSSPLPPETKLFVEIVERTNSLLLRGLVNSDERFDFYL